MSQMTVALHYPNMYSGPVGVWWFAPGASRPDCYYLPDNDAAQVSGNLSMLDVESDVQFADYAQRLADGSSYVEGWGVGTATDQGTPQLILKAARSRAA